MIEIQAKMEWVSVDRVLPNPRNPRRNISVKSKEMQRLIKSKGWQEGITCYERGDFYVILSGHRRWYAAKQLGIKKVPLFLVKAPKSDAEELDRLGSVQGGQVDWSPYELAKYTFDLWKKMNKIPYGMLAKKLNVTKNTVIARIRVYQYYQKVDIEDKLGNNTYSIPILNYIYSWIKKLGKYQPKLLKDLGEDFIKRQMLKKFENKCFNSQIANDRIFVINASANEIMSFLTDATKKLSDCQMETSLTGHGEKIDLAQNSLELISMVDNVEKIKCRTKQEAKKLVEKLQTMLEHVDNKINYFEEAVKK